MKREDRKQRLVTGINITPLTDVALVLLVIFMITTPLISQTNIKVSLPEAKNALPAEGGRKVQSEITITREGMTYLDGKLMTNKELKEKMSLLHKNYPELSVVLRSDKSIQFKNIVGVLDILDGLGIRHLNIATVAEE
ncbi:MAG: biopolymer transporter ExbD [Candidatus Omnitrophica bacterium]|nr:biopolymer transporter ExbD [Candidatus Omnitrophota bacterium]MBU1869666.1 biopolymer transporter ExbD [Candidatus Omnitrophota bacterium]